MEDLQVEFLLVIADFIIAYPMPFRASADRFPWNDCSVIRNYDYNNTIIPASIRCFELPYLLTYA